MSTFLQQGIRTAGSSALPTVTLADMIETLGKISNQPVDFTLLVDGTGQERVHVHTEDYAHYFSIRVSEKAFSVGAELTKERLASIVNNNTIYVGESANGVWFTYSRQSGGGATRTVTVSMEELLGSGKVMIG